MTLPLFCRRQTRTNVGPRPCTGYRGILFAVGGPSIPVLLVAALQCAVAHADTPSGAPPKHAEDLDRLQVQASAELRAGDSIDSEAHTTSTDGAHLVIIGQIERSGFMHEAGYVEPWDRIWRAQSFSSAAAVSQNATDALPLRRAELGYSADAVEQLYGTDFDPVHAFLTTPARMKIAPLNTLVNLPAFRWMNQARSASETRELLAFGSTDVLPDALLYVLLLAGVAAGGWLMYIRIHLLPLRK